MNICRICDVWMQDKMVEKSVWDDGHKIGLSVVSPVEQIAGLCKLKSLETLQHVRCRL